MGSFSNDQLTLKMVAELQRQAKAKSVQITNLRADHLNGYVKPENISGFIPDMTCNFGTAPIVGEAETAEGLKDTHTESQLRAFYTSVCRTTDAVLILGTETAGKAYAEALLKQIAGKSIYDTLPANMRVYVF